MFLVQGRALLLDCHENMVFYNEDSSQNKEQQLEYLFEFLLVSIAKFIRNWLQGILL